ncbi:MAG: ABC transporter ATP-binding protein [Gallionellaceae bacterium]
MNNKTTNLAIGLTEQLVRLWRQFSRRRQRQFFLLVLLMLLSAFAEIVSLGAVLPFLAILTAPDKVASYPIIIKFSQLWGITTPSQLVLPLTLIFSGAALAAGSIRILLMWASIRLTYASGADLSIEVYRRTLNQPYHVHVARNSSEVISGITNKVNGVIGGVVIQVLTFVSSVLLLIGVTAVLIYINPAVAITSIVFFGATYGFTSLVFRKFLKQNSQRIANEQVRVVKALQEGLGGIRDVLLDGTQKFYCGVYNTADQPLRRAQGNILFIVGGPKNVMEIFGMLLIAALAFYLSQQEGGISTALPVLGALALGAQRLLPALQNCYGAWATIVGYESSLVDVVKLLEQPQQYGNDIATLEPLNFHDVICFDAVRFRYSSETPWVLDDFNLNIPKGARVGIVGSTGSGKSTALDILMGLLVPTEGRLLVDSHLINDSHLRAWQRSIAHVPQNIYLADTTLAENIAFGIAKEAIDIQRVRHAAQQAQIADFIESRPEGYDAFVGERGIRLSGGQRQRIGIARALYKQASVLVFDEATSALDNATEGAVIEAVESLNRDLTIVLIAHRLSTVRYCDFIVELSAGRVIAQGTYEHLLECSASFRKIAGVR